jgi:hypothetical protein
MPVPLSVTIGGSPQTVTVLNNGNGINENPQVDEGAEWFVVPVSGTVTALAFDPDQWILRAFSPTSVPYAPGPPKVVQTVPSPGSSVVGTPNPSQLTVWFHTPVNTVNAHYSLVGDVNGPQTVSIVSGANVNPVVISSAAPLSPDTYTLTVTSGVTAVNSGLALDGEVADPMDPASLPSGDGTVGGNAVIRFEVTPCNVLADIDADCDKDPIDIDIFVDVLLENDTDLDHMTRSDVNNSGLPPDALDIQPFVDEHMTP